MGYCSPSNLSCFGANPVGITARIGISPVTRLKGFHNLIGGPKSITTVQFTAVELLRSSGTLRNQLNWFGSAVGLSCGGVLGINLGLGSSIPVIVLDRFGDWGCRIPNLRLGLRLDHDVLSRSWSWDNLVAVLVSMVRLDDQGRWCDLILRKSWGCR